MNFFTMNSPWMRGILKIVTLLYVGILWLIGSLPLITTGVSTTAMYEVLLKAAKDQEGYIGKGFFKAYKNNLRQGISIGAPLLITEILFSVNLFYYGILGKGKFTLQTAVFAILLMAAAAISSYVFPVMAKFENTIPGHIRMAAALAVRNPGWTFVLLVIRVLTLFTIWFFVYFPILFIMGLLGYVQAVIFNHIFDLLIDGGMITEIR